MPKELQRVASLSDSSPLVTEDGWLGSALFRFLGATFPMRLFSVASERHLFIDPIDYRLLTTRAAMVLHHRNVLSDPPPRWFARLRLLDDFHVQAHCRATSGWQATASGTCCTEARRRGRDRDHLGGRDRGGERGFDTSRHQFSTSHQAAIAPDGAGSLGASLRASLGTSARLRLVSNISTSREWPVFRPAPSPCDDDHHRYDLADTAVLRRWGIARVANRTRRATNAHRRSL